VTLPVIVRRWPDMSVVFRGLIGELVGDVANIGTETPEDLASRPWFVRAHRIEGGSDQVNDYPLMEVDVFAATYAVAEPLAERVRQWLTRRRPSPLVDRIDCLSGPHELPWGDGTMRRWGATYEAVARRMAA
jgi:hypothetical protein